MVLLVWHYTTTCTGVGKTVAGEGRTGLGHPYQLNRSTVSTGVWTIVYTFIMRLTVEEHTYGQLLSWKHSIIVTLLWTLHFAFLQCYCEWIVILYVAKEFISRFRTGWEPLVTLLRFQVMPLCGTFFNLNWNITIISFLHLMPRITGEDECHNFSKALKTSQMLLFWPPLLSSGYDVWGGTHATNPLKTENLHHIHFLCHRHAWDNVLCSICKEIFFFTDSSWQNNVRFMFGSARLAVWMRLANPCTTRPVYNVYLTQNTTRRAWNDESEAQSSRQEQRDVMRQERRGADTMD